MRNCIFLAIIFLGCYTPKKAAKDVTKAQTYHPEIVAKKMREWYPNKTETVIDSVAYKNWMESIEELEAQLGQQDTVIEILKDTVVKIIYRKTPEVIKVVEKLRNVPPVVKTITVTDTLGNYLKAKQIESLQVSEKKLTGKLSWWKGFAVFISCLALLFALFIMALLYIRRK